MNKRARGKADDDDGRGGWGKIPEVVGDFTVRDGEDTPAVVAALNNAEMEIEKWLDGLGKDDAQKMKDVMLKNEKRGHADQFIKELSTFNPYITSLNKQNHIFCLAVDGVVFGGVFWGHFWGQISGHFGVISEALEIIL